MRPQHGFTYMGVLLLLAVSGMAAASAVQVWNTARRQEQERELLFIGQQFRAGLQQYARHTPRNGKRGPLRLEDLLQDPRAPGVQRYLRRIYADPLTGRAEWGVVLAADGSIHGVHSLSDKEPLKKSNFALADRQFEGARKYSDWVFVPAQP